MKTLGLIGGISWESTAHYYTRINQLVAQRLGGLHSAELLLYSVEFHEIQALQHQDDWTGCGRIFTDIARRLERAGAEGLVICANTMHILAEEIAAAVSIPLIHIAEATAMAAQDRGIRSVALLGTRFTMEKDFYRRELEDDGLRVLVPDEAERTELHRIIYEELCQSVIKPESKDYFYKVVTRLAKAGADGAVLGCTEFTLIADPAKSPVPLLDTTEIHARAAVDWMLGNE
ncbi:MAG TPA: aspartate/glutamate racemase family protein [Gammaproteobacteria bacterium]|nr:aspartate/glutamate racemase family protein [Gammaproteobacteria bacterium]